LERTVLVSFRSGTKWLTRIYDSEQQADVLRGIYAIIGERLETELDRSLR
jgi:hypothetical protein